jgi:hypothetical protein
MRDPEVKTAIVSELPDCAFCAMEGRTEPAEYDAKTIPSKMFKGRYLDGRWANMCEKHYQLFGVKPLGLGMGQKLVLRGSAKVPESDLSRADELCRRCGKGCGEDSFNKETMRFRILDNPVKISVMLATGLYCEEI